MSGNIDKGKRERARKESDMYAMEEVCTHNNYLNNDTFVIKQIYKEIKGVNNRVPWRKILCNTPAPPNCIFICWLAILGRLSACDRLAKFRVQCSYLCGLYGSVGETLNHLIFDFFC